LDTTRDSAISYVDGTIPGFDVNYRDTAAESRMPSASLWGEGIVFPVRLP